MNINGIAELPLHWGRVPEYLLERMKSLGSLIAKFIVESYGPEELLKRLSDPFWFQAFNNVIGMDWDSSGSTTVVLYVLKSVFPPTQAHEHGLAVLGGKGTDARELPREVEQLKGNFDIYNIVKTSKLAAKVDSVALQDGYDIYIHGIVVSEKNKLLVVQQGMNVDDKIARRYHIYVEQQKLLDCEKDPHSGVASLRVDPALNMVDADSKYARRAVLEIVESTPTNSLVQDLYRVNRVLRGLPEILNFAKALAKSVKPDNLREKVLKCPRFYRPVVDIKHVTAIAEAIKREAPRSFKELLLIRGLGPESLRAIVLVADLIYGYEPSFKDPTTHSLDPFLYAYAHGGKDGVPHRIRVREVDKTIEFFTRVIGEVRAGNSEKELLLRNFSKFVSRIRQKYML